MNLPAADIDAIVHRVLQQLQQPAAAAPASNTPATQPGLASATPGSSTNHSVTVPDRVVTATVLETAITTGCVKSVQVTKSAVITPAAKDWLKQRGIAVERQSPATTLTGSSTLPTWRVLVSTASTTATTALQMAALTHVSTTGTALEAASAATSSICRAESSGVIVLTATPDLVACLCNRQSACRAITAVDAEQLTAAGKQWGPNIVAINPGRRGTMELRRLLQAAQSWNPAAAPRDAGV